MTKRRTHNGSDTNAPPPRDLYDASLLSAPMAEVIRSCSELPAELARQARTPNRCTPARPSSQAWLRRHRANDYVEESVTLSMAKATRVMARRLALDDGDAALRLLVQAIATSRDTGNGPAGDAAMAYSRIAERVLSTGFQHILDHHEPDAATRDEIIGALDELEGMELDTHVYLTSWELSMYDIARFDPIILTAEERNFNEYSAALSLERVMEACPPGIAVAECAERFPLPSVAPPTWEALLRGPKGLVRD